MSTHGEPVGAGTPCCSTTGRGPHGGHGVVGVTGEHTRGRLMSTTDDMSTSTPDALDPITVDEVEQALTAVQGGGETTDDGGIPQAEATRPGGTAHLDT